MASSTRVFRGACAVMGVYFLFATVVQINDPDALVWMALYGAAACVTLAAAWRTLPVWMPATLAAIAALGAIALMPAAVESSFRELFESWQMMSAGMEIGRELLGLLILAAWMVVLTFHTNSRTAAPAGVAKG